MRISTNGESFPDLCDRVLNGEFGLYRAGCAHALVSFKNKRLCIEAVEGKGGTELTSALVAAAKCAGWECEAWVFNRARARLAGRAGMKLTGVVRVGANGIEQLQVST